MPGYPCCCIAPSGGFLCGDCLDIAPFLEVSGFTDGVCDCSGLNRTFHLNDTGLLTNPSCGWPLSFSQFCGSAEFAEIIGDVSCTGANITVFIIVEIRATNAGVGALYLQFTVVEGIGDAKVSRSYIKAVDMPCDELDITLTEEDLCESFDTVPASCGGTITMRLFV